MYQRKKVDMDLDWCKIWQLIFFASCGEILEQKNLFGELICKTSITKERTIIW